VTSPANAAILDDKICPIYIFSITNKGNEIKNGEKKEKNIEVK
jgi:hypothetical protein